MSIVYTPPRDHRCRTPLGPGGPLEGSVWQCECGKTWVSLGVAHRRYGDLTVKWREEGRRERKKRERQAMPSELRGQKLDNEPPPPSEDA